MTWTMPSRPLPVAKRGTPNSAQLAANASSCAFARGSVTGPAVGRDVVIHRRDGQIGTPDAPSRQPKAVERLSRRHLVDEVKIDEEKRRLAGLFPDDVAFPDAVEERLRHCMQSTTAFRAPTRACP